MNHSYVFNGDADGLCALQQLRLDGAPPGELITGVKRDIALLARVVAGAHKQEGDRCTVLDISLDVNRAPLLALLEAGVQVRYFDHHFTGEVPKHPGLEPHLDLSPEVCTSLLVDRALDGRFRRWAIVGLFGDGLDDVARPLCAPAGLDAPASERLKELGVAINYNAYGETIADLHVPPVDLAEEMARYSDPLAFAEGSATCRRLAEGFRQDMELARSLAPARRSKGAVFFTLPDAAWARRASGTLANDLARSYAGEAVAIVSPKIEGGYLVSVRVPRDSSVSAEAFCRTFPTGGGRRTAAGINHLPGEDLQTFADAFEARFGAP